MVKNGQYSDHIPSLQTLAFQVESTPGNNILHQLVLDDSNSGHFCSESWKEYVNTVLMSLNDSRIPVNALNREGYSALHLAVLKNNALMVENLLACLKTRINVNIKDKLSKTPLYMAADLGYDKVVKELLKIPGILINEKWDHNYTPLHRAVKKGYHSTVKELLKAPGILINEKCNICTTKSHYKNPIIKNDADYCGMLFRQIFTLPFDGVLENFSHCRTREERLKIYTPLALAVENGYYRIVQELLKAPGILINEKSKYDFTPLHIAVGNGYNKIIQELRKAPGILKPKNSETLNKRIAKRKL